MHGNAPLTPEGRLRLCHRIEDGWTVAAAAESMNISRQCAHKWWRRYRDEGVDGLRDRSSRPWSCPHQTPARVERRIVALRQSRKLGPARLAGIVGVPASTVHRVLVRHGVNRLRWMDRPTGRVIRRIDDQPLRRAGPHRREETGPGPRRRRPQQARSQHRDPTSPAKRAATPTSTPRSTPTRGSPTASSPASRTPTTASRSSTEPSPGSPPTASRIERILTDNGNGYRSDRLARPLRRARHPPHPHPALPARHQRQSRTLQPHPRRRMGLRPTLEIRTPAEPEPLTACSTATTITDTTPPSAAHPPAASPTWQGTTPSPV